MNLRLALAFSLSTLLAAGCYYEDTCALSGGDTLEADPGPGQRNPYSGQCDYFGGGGGGGSGSSCGDYGGPDYPAPQAEDRAPTPEWGMCNGFCESLSLDDCVQVEECRASYVGGCPPDADCDETVVPEFNQCWAITPGGGYSEDGCRAYEAEECARHNECSAVHWNVGDAGYGDFAYCIDESGGDSDPGSCVGDALCEMLPPECPDGTTPGIRDNCFTGYCIPLGDCEELPVCSTQSENSCVARLDCEPVYEGIDCTCDGDDCTCADWSFQSCS
ncbi:MAG: hypothetical protein GY811_10500 [Myxococcales bacterium]|nr:hypothetical protein [Myxococcales bacterium]